MLIQRRTHPITDFGSENSDFEPNRGSRATAYCTTESMSSEADEGAGQKWFDCAHQKPNLQPKRSYGMGSKVILYFVRYPQPGKVKTRLAKTVGHDEAARMYRDLALKNFNTIKDLREEGIECIVVFDPYDKQDLIERWLDKANGYWAQQGGDVGQRLDRAFESAFAKKYYQVIALGSDTLGLQAGILRKGFGVLETHDTVLGPAQDGGYYLIGLSSLQSTLFTDIPWSTPEVLKTTLQRIQEQRLSFGLLEALEDLDEVVPNIFK